MSSNMTWNQYLKKEASERGLTYKAAMTHPEIRNKWQEMKSNNKVTTKKKKAAPPPEEKKAEVPKKKSKVKKVLDKESYLKMLADYYEIPIEKARKRKDIVKACDAMFSSKEVKEEVKDKYDQDSSDSDSDAEGGIKWVPLV